MVVLFSPQVMIVAYCGIVFSPQVMIVTYGGIVFSSSDDSGLLCFPLK